MSPRVLLHAAPFVPSAQLALVRQALERTFPAGFRLERSGALTPSKALQVAPWIAQSLQAKRSALRSGSSGALYLDARLFVPRDLSGLVTQPRALSDAPSLRQARLLWIPEPLVQGLDPGGSYDALADQPIPAEPLPRK